MRERSPCPWAGTSTVMSRPRRSRYKGARGLDQAPGHEKNAAETTDDAAHAKRHEEQVADDKKAMAAEKKNPGPYNDEFNTAVGRAEISAASLARAQNRGLAIVKD